MYFLKCNCYLTDCPVYNKCCFLPTEVHPDRKGTVSILFVGQGGGSEERKKCRPFIGKAGKRLRNQIILAMKRYGSIFGVAFSNNIRDNPDNNRVPNKIELEKCMQFLHRDINILSNKGLKAIISLGKSASESFGIITNTESISNYRGKIFDYQQLNKIKIIPTFHPSFFNIQKIKYTPEKLHEKEELVINDILTALNLES